MIRLLPSALSAALVFATLAIPANAHDLACRGDERDCQRFVGETARHGHRVPAKGGPKHTVNAGRVALDLTAWELERERRCLAIAAYAEARDQGTAGMLAVMWVILNRVERGMNGADRPCEAVAQPAAIEAMSRPEFGKQLRAIRRGAMPPLVRTDAYPDELALRNARLLAFRALGTGDRLPDDLTKNATHYWSPKQQKRLGRSKPDWAKTLVRTARIGDHVFYRLRVQVAEAR
jgi:cell wall hydrolase